MTNLTSIPLQISLQRSSSKWQDVGVCHPITKSTGDTSALFRPTGTFNLENGMLSKASKSFGIRGEFSVLG